jgi:GT2 family glycosyltransferase
MPVMVFRRLLYLPSTFAILQHLGNHAWSLLRRASSQPGLVARYIVMGFVYLGCLGYRRTATKVSSRIRKWMAVEERDGCKICAWARRRSLEFGPEESKKWLRAYRPSERLLAKFRARQWPGEAPLFTIVMPVCDPQPKWLRMAIRSVRDQTYGRWELLCVDDGSRRPAVGRVLAEESLADSRIRVIRCPANRGVSAASNLGLRAARGDYVCFLDHDDVLEPQALHRFAESVLEQRVDFLYSDEAITGAEVEDVRSIVCRPSFSYDHYLSHPYLVHLIAVRAELLREIGGFDESMQVSQDVDLLLRVIERAKQVTHVPEVLYRWRTNRTSLGHAKQHLVNNLACGALERHLQRLGCDATVRPVAHNFRDVVFRAPPQVKVAIIIPTKNQAEKLQPCLASLERSVSSGLADIVVVNHQSDEPETLALLANVRRSHRVLEWTGTFNFSAMMNFAVAEVRGPYTHYLFLNNDTEATAPGWLEHMVGLASRPDVGVVGPILLYPDHTIQHAGVVIGMFNCAEHFNKFAPMFDPDGVRDGGPGGMMLCTRDVSAVTGASLLIGAEVFDEVGGFDESLAIGFGDTDLCLRAREAGLKVLIDAHAVLIHHESITRGKSDQDPHLADSRKFIARYRKLIRAGDPFYSPYFHPDSNFPTPVPSARAPEYLQCRSTTIELPGKRSEQHLSGPEVGATV